MQLSFFIYTFFSCCDLKFLAVPCARICSSSGQSWTILVSLWIQYPEELQICVSIFLQMVLSNCLSFMNIFVIALVFDSHKSLSKLETRFESVQF